MTGDPAEELLAGFRTVTATLAAAHGRSLRSGPAAQEVPVTLLTGFLGSGKTTVLRHLLTGDHGLRITAIVNDLGAVNIDAAALAGIGPEADRLSLSNGCACCALDDELADTLQTAAGAEPPPDAIVIEASGAADAVAMAATIEAGPSTRLDGIVCVVDAAAWPEQLAHPALGPRIRRQVETAHLVVLSKVDLVAKAAVDGIVASVAGVAPGRQVLPTSDGAVDPSILLGAATHGIALRPGSEPHRLDLATRTVRLDGPIDEAAVARWLESDHGLVRAKGWLTAKDGRPRELQLVGRRWTLRQVDEAPENAVVIIGDAAAVELAARVVGGDQRELADRSLPE